MKNYSSALTGRTQQQPIFGRTDMVKNAAGGFSFEITPQERLERFILIGSEGGTYHIGEQELTEANATSIVAYIKTNGLKVVETVTNFLTNNRAPKTDAGLFVLALASTYGNEETKKAAYSAISQVCKTSTHLFTFLANVQNLRKWSRGLRGGVAKFYTSRTADQVAYQMVKYRDRAGFTHKDALRLSHPQTVESNLNSLFAYAVGKKTATDIGGLVGAYERAKEAEEKELLGLIKEYGLTWEMIPNEKLNSQKVLSALLDKMPLTALIKNLNRFSYNGMTDSNNDTVKTIVGKLTNEEAVKKAGIHPLNVINYMFAYKGGHGIKGNKSWSPNQNIVDALADTYEMALKAITPTGKSILVAVDVSPSMSAPVNGMNLNAMQIANVLGLTLIKSEKNAELVCFDTKVVKPTFGRRNSVDEVVNMRANGSGTDCAQAFVHALKTKTKYDAIIILTDNETWSGPKHGLELLNQYRKEINRDVKVVELAMVANPTTNLPVDEKNVLRVVGFDASVMEVINTFLE
jgi:60 kDa SS-A/Ro ribonucleoprotein